MWKRLTASLVRATEKFVGALLGFDEQLVKQAEELQNAPHPVNTPKPIRRKKKVVRPKSRQVLSPQEIVDQMGSLVIKYKIHELKWPFPEESDTTHIPTKAVWAILHSKEFTDLLEQSLPISFGPSPRNRAAPLISCEEFLPIFDALNYHIEANRRMFTPPAVERFVLVRGIRRLRMTFATENTRFTWLLNFADIISVSCPNKKRFADPDSESEQDPEFMSTIENSASEAEVVRTTEPAAILRFPDDPPALEDLEVLVLNADRESYNGQVDIEATARLHESHKRISDQ